MSGNPTFVNLTIDDLRCVESKMRAQSEGYQSDLNAALELLLSSGGKRLRPIITLLIGKMLNAPLDRLTTLAAAIELLHTATLVHDDLIDGSLLRRGMPTLNAQWTPGATVLTGDFLFSRAAKLAADTESVPAIKLFSQTLTIIVNGEITQMFTGRCQVNRANYYERIYAKTASLIETSAKSAALIANVDEQTTEAMRIFGYQTGMAFQIVDDILDFTSEESTLGKPVGSDLRQGLITLPALIYFEQHPDNPDVQELLDGNCLHNDAQADRLIQAIRKSSAIDAAYQEAQHNIEFSIIALQGHPTCAERYALEELAAYIIQRNK